MSVNKNIYHKYIKKYHTNKPYKCLCNYQKENNSENKKKYC